MPLSLFRSGLTSRAIAAVAYGALALGGAWLLQDRAAPDFADRGAAAETTRDIAPLPVASPAAAVGGERLEIESILPVRTWNVRVDGETRAPESMDAHHWRGPCDATASVLAIDTVADAAPTPAAPSSSNSLRLRLAGGGLSIEWIEWVRAGELTVVPLDQLRASAPAPAAERASAAP